MALGEKSAAEYDPSGRVTALTDPAGAITKAAYDDGGRMAAIIDPLGNGRGAPGTPQAEFWG